MKLSVNWILWIGTGTAVTASTMGASPVAALSIATLFLLAWATIGVTPKTILKVGSDALVELYFREYLTVGEEKIPDGPVIFVCGPHSNQFLDPTVVSRGTKRDIRYIIAAKSLRRSDVGWLFKFADPVPVERQQDLTRKGKGKVSIQAHSAKVSGFQGTQFMKDMPAVEKGKYQLRLTLKDQPKPVMLTVKEVQSNSELLLETASSSTLKKDATMVDYKIVPPVSHDEMFNAVYDHLGNGGALGIFPEGGSHDRTMLLPLKVGVCIMALGAMKKFPQCNVRLVPVGLNYFSQHRFNSRVLVKFGDAIDVEQDIKSDYLAGGERKREAVCNLLEKVQGALQEVTVCAPDWSMLKTFWTLRDLYTPSKRLLTMTSVEKVLLAQAFASDYNRVKEDQAVNPLLERIKKYSRKLHALGLKDKGNLESAMLMHSHSTLYLCCLLVLRCFRLLILFVIFSPVYLKLMPVYLISTAYSLKKSKEAVAASSVKIIGKDVMGTYKLIIALPLLAVGHASITFFLLCYFGETAAVAYYFFAPFAQFVVYKLMPNDLALVRSTYHLALAMLFKQDQTQILDERNKLKEETRNLVDRLEWGFHDKHVTDFDRTQTINFSFSGHFANKDESAIFQSLQDFELDLWKMD